MKQIPFLATLLISSYAPAWAELIASPAIASLEAGIVCPPETIGSTPAPGTIAGETHLIATEPDFVSNTRIVPAVLDLGFGVKAQTTDPSGAAPVTIRLTHPAMGDGAVTEQVFVTSISGSDPSLTFYQFDYAYELVLGTWQFSATQGDSMLFTASFEVVAPDRAPDLAGVCDFVDLLS